MSKITKSHLQSLKYHDEVYREVSKIIDSVKREAKFGSTQYVYDIDIWGGCLAKYTVDDSLVEVAMKRLKDTFVDSEVHYLKDTRSDGTIQRTIRIDWS